jgi:hypothetical protein
MARPYARGRERSTSSPGSPRAGTSLRARPGDGDGTPSTTEPVRGRRRALPGQVRRMGNGQASRGMPVVDTEAGWEDRKVVPASPRLPPLPASLRRRGVPLRGAHRRQPSRPGRATADEPQACWKCRTWRGAWQPQLAGWGLGGPSVVAGFHPGIGLTMRAGETAARRWVLRGPGIGRQRARKFVPSPRRSCQRVDTPTRESRHRAVAARERRRLAGARAGGGPRTHASDEDLHGNGEVSGLPHPPIEISIEVGKVRKNTELVPSPHPLSQRERGFPRPSGWGSHGKLSTPLRAFESVPD